MAKKTSGSGRKAANNKRTKSSPRATTVRNSAIPKPAARQPLSARKPRAALVTYEMIAQRAYEISQSPMCGSEFDNWVRAERELRGA